MVDRNGKAYATPSQGILAAASGGSTQAAGSSAGGVSSNGALTDVLGGGVNEGSAIARNWSTEGSPVDYFTVEETGGASGMDSSMSLMCGLKCQIHGIIHGWGSKSTLSVSTVYYGIQAIDYAMMVMPSRIATSAVVKTSVKNSAIAPIQIGVARGSANTVRQLFRSIKDHPNYPQGFRASQDRTTKNIVKDKDILDMLRREESGAWRKIYKDGFDGNGNKVSLHYFQSKSGAIFDFKVKNYWSSD